jgi:hypothetical protein
VPAKELAVPLLARENDGFLVPGELLNDLNGGLLTPAVIKIHQRVIQYQKA